jgi:AP-2 complex subunit alpha
LTPPALLAPPRAAGYEALQPKLMKILERLVFVKDVTPDYTYYGIPSPWLQGKVGVGVHLC